MTGAARARLAAMAAAFAAVCAAGPAPAQTSLDSPPLDERSTKRLDRLEKAFKELRAVVFQGRETGQPVIVQPADTQGQVAALSDRINELSQSLARLNGQMEVVRHDLDQSRRETGDLRVESAALEARLAAADRQAQAAAPPPAPVAPQDPEAGFAAAQTAFAAGDTTGAEAGFRGYLDAEGDGPKGPEARYWLARTLIARKAWSDAAQADIEALHGWPKVRWAPAAVLDLSRALVALEKPDDACQALGELAKRYPAAAPSVRRGAAELRVRAQCGCPRPRTPRRGWGRGWNGTPRRPSWSPFPAAAIPWLFC
ncbi:MAG: tol-pal system protein YbgF [Caulobacteraceae bacterium]